MGLALDDVDFDGFDVHAIFFQPFNCCFHFVARAVQFQADNPDFVGDAGLADVGDDFELVADFPDKRLFNEPGRVHKPQSLLGGRFGTGRRWFFLCFWHGGKRFEI
jgi:hypothetical protein